MKAKCEWCKKPMDVDTCEGNKLIEYPDGKKLSSLTNHFNEENGKCHDCGIVHGGKHHPGCDVERCPRCKGQLISCGCLEEQENDNR